MGSCARPIRSSTNNQLVSTKSQTRLRDIVDGTSNTFLVGEKHVPRSKFGQSGPSWGDGCHLQRRLPPQFQPDRRPSAIQPGPGPGRPGRAMALQVRQLSPRHLPVCLLRRPRGDPEELDRHAPSSTSSPSETTGRSLATIDRIPQSPMTILGGVGHEPSLADVDREPVRRAARGAQRRRSHWNNPYRSARTSHSSSRSWMASTDRERSRCTRGSRASSGSPSCGSGKLNQKKTIRLHGYPFYDERVAPQGSDLEQFTSAFSEARHSSATEARKPAAAITRTTASNGRKATRRPGP